MARLKAVCKTSKKSVPRNRVFSKYAQRCGDERVIPLNPASFGKLVRVIFPGIQTRRLGVRGESKYHYVDLELINDAEDDGARRPSTAYSHQPGLQGQGSVPPKLNFNHISEISADTAAFRPQDQIPESQSSRFSQTASKGRLFTDIYSEEFHSHTGRLISESYDYELRFATPEQLAPEDNGAIILPDIISYLPPNTDPDSANALVALYRTHCTSLIDSVRYCKEKQFFRLYTSFHGTLTVPVQKLFAQQEIAPWIRECDWMMYQKMIRNVAQLTLQVAPQQVLKFLDNVEKMLRPHLVKVCSGLPTHVLESRLEPATLFTHLLRQMQRVNSTAHAAAVLLMGDQNRDQMWADWVRLVNVKRIIENELPQSCDHEEVYNILKTEMRAMLLPLREGVWMADGSFFPTQAETSPDCTNDTVIDRIALFLTRLPARFPHLSARMMLHCINAIGSAALREITVENGQSFQGWWLTKVFVDEMGQWLASLGGFLGHSPPAWSPTSLSPGTMDESVQNNMVNAESGSNNNSRYSSIDAEYGPNQSFMSNTNGHVQERGNVNPGSQSHTSPFHPHVDRAWPLTNPRRSVSSRRNTGQYDHMSFNMEYDMATSQQELSHDDSGIALLDDTIEVKLTPNFQQSLATQLGQIPTQHPSGGVIN
jgi:regulatory factor X